MKLPTIRHVMIFPITKSVLNTDYMTEVERIHRMTTTCSYTTKKRKLYNCSNIKDNVCFLYNWILNIWKCDTAVQTDNYAVLASYAAGIVLVVLIICLLYHRKLKRRVQTVHLDELRQRMDEKNQCYHNDNLLQHHQHHHHHHNHQYHSHFHHHHHHHNHQQQQQQQQQQHYQDATNDFDSRYQLESSISPASESEAEEASSLNSV